MAASSTSGWLRISGVVVAVGVLVFVAFRTGAKRARQRDAAESRVLAPAKPAPMPGTATPQPAGEPAPAPETPPAPKAAPPAPTFGLTRGDAAQAATSPEMLAMVLRMMRTRHAQALTPIFQSAGIPEALHAQLIEILAEKSVAETRLSALMLAPGIGSEEHARLRAEYELAQSSHLARLHEVVGDRAKSDPVALFLAQEPDRALLASYRRSLAVAGLDTTPEQDAALVNHSHRFRQEARFTVDLSNPMSASPADLASEEAVARYVAESRRMYDELEQAMVVHLRPEQLDALRSTTASRLEGLDRSLRAARTRILNGN